MAQYGAASSRSSMYSVGSEEWMRREVNVAKDLLHGELEDLAFAARHELEWIQEHTMEVLTGERRNLAAMMQTPGRLIGTSPRKRHRNALKDMNSDVPRLDFSAAFKRLEENRNTKGRDVEVPRKESRNENVDPLTPLKGLSGQNSKHVSPKHGSPKHDNPKRENPEQNKRPTQSNEKTPASSKSKSPDPEGLQDEGSFLAISKSIRKTAQKDILKKNIVNKVSHFSVTGKEPNVALKPKEEPKHEMLFTQSRNAMERQKELKDLTQNRNTMDSMQKLSDPTETRTYDKLVKPSDNTSRFKAVNTYPEPKLIVFSNSGEGRPITEPKPSLSPDTRRTDLSDVFKKASIASKISDKSLSSKSNTEDDFEDTSMVSILPDIFRSKPIAKSVENEAQRGIQRAEPASVKSAPVKSAKLAVASEKPTRTVSQEKQAKAVSPVKIGTMSPVKPAPATTSKPARIVSQEKAKAASPVKPASAYSVKPATVSPVKKSALPKLTKSPQKSPVKAPAKPLALDKPSVTDTTEESDKPRKPTLTKPTLGPSTSLVKGNLKKQTSKGIESTKLPTNETTGTKESLHPTTTPHAKPLSSSQHITSSTKATKLVGPSTSLVKNALLNQSKKKLPPVEGVHFSNEKINFGSSISSASNSTSNSSTSNDGSSLPRIKESGTDPRPLMTPKTATNPPHTLKIPAIKSRQQKSVNAGAIVPKTVLPEIFSESEDDDDDSVLADWARTPELRAALEAQQKVDPETVFGPIAPLDFEEVFKNSKNQMRPRSSSANWTGQDRLSEEEKSKFKREMGYR